MGGGAAVRPVVCGAVVVCGEETRERKLFTLVLGEEREMDLMGEAGGGRWCVRDCVEKAGGRWCVTAWRRPSRCPAVQVMGDGTEN